MNSLNIQSLNKYYDKEKLERYLSQPKVQNYLNISLTFFTLSIFIGFAIRPSLSTAVRLNKEVKEFTKIDDALTQKIKALTRARELQEQYSDSIALIDKTIPAESMESVILKNINYLAIKDSVILDNISYRYSTNGKYNIIDMDIKVSGSYTNIKMLLADINTLLRVINIDALTFNVSPIIDNEKEEVATQSLILEGIIKARAFYQLEQIRNSEQNKVATPDSN